MLTSLIVLFLLTAILFAGSPLLAIAQPQTGATATTTPPGSSNNTNTTGADTTPPVVDIARGIEVQTPSGTILHFLVQASDNVDGGATLYTNNVLQQDDAIAGNIRISCNPTSGSIFSIGDTTIQCAAIDEAGNRGLASFTVSVTESGVSSSGTITTSLSSNPPMYNGSCPTTIEFSGTITDNGGNRDVRYRFIRSDGATGPEEVIRFDQPGSQTVSMTWDIGRSYQGWVAIEILQPTQLQSNRAEFELTCAPSTGALPGGADTTGPVLTVPDDIVVETTQSSEIVLFKVTAEDNVDGSATLDEANNLIQDNVNGSITITCGGVTSGSNFPVSQSGGFQEVECYAYDQAGNRGAAQFTISVRPSQAAIDTTPLLAEEAPPAAEEEQPPVVEEEAPVEEQPPAAEEPAAEEEEAATTPPPVDDTGGG